MLARAQGQRAGEFLGLDGDETRRAVMAGWRVLKLAGIEADGFVAPAYAYTSALREELSLRFRWWAGLLRVHNAQALLQKGSRPPLSPAFSLATAGPLSRLLCPPLVRIGSLLPTSSLRLDVHPADLGRSRH